MTTSQVEKSQVDNEARVDNNLQKMIDREIVAASINAYRKLGRADSRNAMPVEVVDGKALDTRQCTALTKFIELAEAKVDFAVIQKKPNPLQGFAKFNPENGTVYELQGVAPNQTEVMKDLTGFVVPIVPSLFLSQHQVAGTGKILKLPQHPAMPEEYTDVVASSDTLRLAQCEAVRKLNAPMSFIWGPPGTGKTYTISQVILEIASQGGKVFVTSTADKAVKGALNALTKLDRPPICEFLEDSDPTGHPHREYDKNMKAYREEKDRDTAAELHELAKEALRDAGAIFVNSLRLIANQANLIEAGRPTHIIIDEVSMMPVYMVSLIKNAFPTAKLIFVGDPNQLSPVVIDSEVAKSNYGKNVYQLVGLDNPKLSKSENFVTFLDQTSRMPARLTQAISDKWYKGALKSTREIGKFDPLCGGQPEVIYDFNGMPDQGLSFPEPRYGWKNSNKGDAQTVVKVAKIALDNQREVMIISPYTGQVSLINHYLKANNLNQWVQATTVHKAQGAEADIVIWSVVANNPHFNKPGNSQADMIATVALSRAKQQVFIVGAKEGTVAYDFIRCYEQVESGAQQAPNLSVEMSNAPELSPDEEYRGELVASAAEEFLEQDNAQALEVPEHVDEPEPISSHVERCHYYPDWFDWNNLDTTIWQNLRVDGVCTQKANERWREPRLTAWFSEEGVSYEYSGIQHQSQGWPDWVRQLAQGVKAQYGERYHQPNSVLVNVYRNGNDYVSMHRDDEPLFDATQPIASVSLGATRAFTIGNSRQSVDHTIDLENKSLLLMLPGFQDRYWHGVPRQPNTEGARINLTFRYVKPQKTAEYSGPTTVVNLNDGQGYDVYIGRAGQGLDGYFGNPIVRGQECCVCGDTHLDNESVVTCYRKRFYRMIEEDGAFAKRISQLKGKRLGCFCKPDHCHGDVIAEYLESPEDAGSDLSFEPAKQVVKLESEDFTPALAYAGIGSRKTPGEVLQYMTQQATLLESMDCLLRTGNAKGADQAFCNGAKYKSVYTPEQPILDWAREKVAEVCDNDYSTFRPITQNLLARNMYQLFGDGNTPDACYPSKFVLYWSEPSSEYNSSQQDNYFNCSSGTRYAVRAAVKAGIPTFNLYNQKELWEQYRDNGFEFPEVVKQVVELTAPDPTPEPERDMTQVNRDRADMLEYVMQLLNSEGKS